MTSFFVHTFSRSTKSLAARKRASLIFCALPFLSLASLLPLPKARAFEPPQPHSVSVSRQFVIYCDNTIARGEIADFAEDTKSKLLVLLGESDRWKFPIIINLIRPDAAQSAHHFASNVSLFEIENDFKIELDISLQADPREVRFQQQLIRAMLIEFAYRDHPERVQHGTPFADPPRWLIEGATLLFQNHEKEPNASFFKSLVRSNRLPSLADFLAQNSDQLDNTSREVYANCAMSLVHLLSDLPDGHSSLAAFVRHWPQAKNDSFAELIKRFPMLGVTTQSSEKWWALGIARLSAVDRYQGLSLEDTEQRLSALLSVEIAVDKSGKQTKTFSLDQFEQFQKIPASRAAMKQMSTNLLALSTSANPLYRSVISEYQTIATNLARGKARHAKEELAALADYRQKVLHRMDDIADYMNWFEATQMTSESGTFDGFIKASNSVENDAADKRQDPITRYVDEVEFQLQDQ